ncbi:hypothetical protein QWZ13_16875 [Reinekea marina]|uniref:Quercetin 2,3-dioxygenase C-terminal cupin domain-containing protein n=1 Tax=Reinekea marina TaxID=1310421 RepID=A0ABV7WQF1_9GAMM|nr:hypothetical protein [Reinekea marina]MDN3650581.1 hypothetical protein [Reinekea marina]
MGSGTYVRLDEGLDIDKSELKQEDFEVLNGETITLTDDAAVYPLSSSRALVYIEWIP